MTNPGKSQAELSQSVKTGLMLARMSAPLSLALPDQHASGHMVFHQCHVVLT